MTRIFALLWIGWCAYFAVVEGTAFILRRPDLTLSDFTWRLEGAGWTSGRSRAIRIARYSARLPPVVPPLMDTMYPLAFSVPDSGPAVRLVQVVLPTVGRAVALSSSVAEQTPGFSRNWGRSLRAGLPVSPASRLRVSGPVAMGLV